METQNAIPVMPPIGYPERYYAVEVRRAEKNNDSVLRHALKAAQYITLALDPSLAWLAKQRYFEHAICRHCCVPACAPDEVNCFYDMLRTLIQKHAGEEAVRLCSREDDKFAARIARGESPVSVKRDAEHFFSSVIKDPAERPEYFSRADWRQLVMIHGQWVGTSPR